MSGRTCSLPTKGSGRSLQLGGAGSSLGEKQDGRSMCSPSPAVATAPHHPHVASCIYHTRSVSCAAPLSLRRCTQFLYITHQRFPPLHFGPQPAVTTAPCGRQPAVTTAPWILFVLMHARAQPEKAVTSKKSRRTPWGIASKLVETLPLETRELRSPALPTPPPQTGVPASYSHSPCSTQAVPTAFSPPLCFFRIMNACVYRSARLDTSGGNRSPRSPSHTSCANLAHKS